MTSQVWMWEDRVINGHVIYLLEEATVKQIALFYIGSAIFLPTHGFKEEALMLGFKSGLLGPALEQLLVSPAFTRSKEKKKLPGGAPGAVCRPLKASSAKPVRNGTLTTEGGAVSDLPISVFPCKQYSLGNYPTNKRDSCAQRALRTTYENVGEHLFLLSHLLF